MGKFFKTFGSACVSEKSAQLFIAVGVKLPASLSTKNGRPTVGHNGLGLKEVAV